LLCDWHWEKWPTHYYSQASEYCPQSWSKQAIASYTLIWKRHCNPCWEN